MPQSKWYQAATSFAALWAAYWMYGLLVVPWVESVPPKREKSVVSEATQAAYEPPTARYASIIQPLFGENSWERGSDVHIVKTKSAGFILLLRELKTLPNGQVSLNPCTIVHLPDKRDSRTWIIQSTDAALLQFERPFNLQNDDVGSFQSGLLRGQVIISGDSGEPGGDDRIEIETSVVQFSLHSISTTQDVHFRFGKSFGSGRDLTIRLANEEDAGSVRNAKGRLPSPSGSRVDTIELVHLREAVLFPTTPANRLEPTPDPVRLSCDGPVLVDLRGGLARVSRNVHVIRQRGDRPSEKIQCEQLQAHLVSQPSPLASAGGRTPIALPKWQLDRIVATGTPARVSTTSTPARGASRKPERWFQLESTRFEYTFVDSAIPGPFQAIGMGTFSTGEHGSDEGQLELTWHERMEVHPHREEVDLALVGDARCRANSLGSVQAGTIWVRMSLAAEGGRGALGGIGSGNASNTMEGFQRLKPKSIVAEQSVDIRNEQLHAKTQRLDVVFRESAGELASGGGSSLGPQLASPRAASRPTSRGRMPVEVYGDRMEIHVEADGETHRIDEITLEGRVFAAEQPRGESTAPLEMKGDHLRLSHVTESGGIAVIRGQPAMIRARRLNLTGGSIHLDREQNQMWIDGSGAAAIPLPDRVAQQYPSRPAVADVHWEGGLRFDGQSVQCRTGVEVRGPAQRIRSDSLTVSLSQPIRFGTSNVRMDDVELSSILADGNVDIENQTIDEMGWVSVDRARLAQLQFDYATEEVTGKGPGWIETVRRGEVMRQPDAPASANAGASGNGRLAFLHIDFEQGFDGGLSRRQITFRNRVRAIYGPVSDWNEKRGIGADGQPQPETVLLNCQELTAFQLPGRAKANTIELSATGDVIVEGKAPQGQLFVARGQRLSFSQEKDVLVLDGSGRAEAELWHQEHVGGPRNTVSASQIRYSPGTNRYQMQGGNRIDFTIGP